MSLKNLFSLTIFYLFFITSVFAENMARVIYEKPINKYEAKIEKEIRDSGVIEDVTVFINEQFRLS
jgi:hypothetical protein